MVQKIMERIWSIEKYWSEVFCSDYCDVSVNKNGVKCGASLRFWENKGWIKEIDLYAWLRWYLDTGWVADQKMIKDKLTDGKKLWVGLEVN